MTCSEIVADLKKLGNEGTKKVFLNHGAKEPFFGVKIEDLKKIQKKVKKNYQLALELFATGISDAMYLAGLIADETRMTKKDLEKWVQGATWHGISHYTVAWVAAESRFGWELALKWINSTKENIAGAGWSTLSSLVSIKPDEELDLKGLEKLLERVENTIHAAPNRVKYSMNGFVIAVGGAVPSLTKKAQAAAKKIGKVEVDMGDTSCKVPDALSYIQKIIDKGKLGKKRKEARC